MLQPSVLSRLRPLPPWELRLKGLQQEQTKLGVPVQPQLALLPSVWERMRLMLYAKRPSAPLLLEETPETLQALHRPALQLLS